MVIIRPCPSAILDLYLAHQQAGTLRVLLAAVCLKASTVCFSICKRQRLPIELSRWVNFPN